MVQILRDQMRDYQADVSGAIREGQIAQTVSDWNQVIQGAGKIGMSMAENRQKAQEKADQNVINTQIGQQANISAQDTIDKEMKAGKLDPYSPAGMERINKIYAEAYSGHIEGMGSEKGRMTLEEMARKGADSSILSSRKAYDKVKEGKAMSAVNYIDLYNSDVSHRAGQALDYDTFNNFTESSAKPIVEYMVAHGADKDKDTAYAKWRLRQGTNYLMGVAESNPIEASRLLGISNRQEIENTIKEQNPKISKKELKQLVDRAMADESDVTKQKLTKIFGDKVLNTYGETEDKAIRNLQDNLKTALGRTVEKNMKLDSLKQEENRYKSAVSLYTDLLSPNDVISASAELSMIDNPETDGQFAKEVDMNAFKLSLDTYKNNSVDIKQEKYPTGTGTLNLVDSLRGFALDTDSTPAQKIMLGLNVNNEAHDEPITQEQYEQTNNIVFNSLTDPEYQKNLNKTMHAANILDVYADLFTEDKAPEWIKSRYEEEEKAVEEYMQKNPGATWDEANKYVKNNPARTSELIGGSSVLKEYSGLKEDKKTGKFVDFDYDKASEQNKQKYRLVRDTYAGVIEDVANKDFESANKKIFSLPYRVALINYEGRISQADLDRFMERDLQGNGSVYPEFQYKGYTFQYLGIKKNGEIIAKRRI